MAQGNATKLPSTARRGHRTLIEALDELVEKDPRRPYALVPKSDDLSQGFDTVYVEQVGRAVDSFAYKLLEYCDGSRDDGETVVYIGVNDLRYSMIMFAAIKCGKEAMFISPRNTDDQNVRLLQSKKCTRILHSSEMHALASSIKAKDPGLELIQVEVLETWVASFSKPFLFSKSFEQAKWDNVVTLHSSGSTGDPKPITLNNGMFAANLERKLPEVPGRETPGHRIYDFEGGGKYLAPLPPFHMAGLMAQLYYPIFAQSAYPVMGPTTRAVTAEDMKMILDTHDIRIMFTAPAFIEHIASMPGGTDALARLEYLMFSGGPLSASVGDRLAPHVQIASFYGSIELGLAPFVMPNREDWQWLEFHPAYAPTLEPYSSEGDTYELVLRKTGDPVVDEMRGTYWTSPQADEYRTKDLFVPHPTKTGLWRFHGRLDDTIVLNTGEKWNPVPTENHVLGCPDVGGCLAVGSNRPGVALLVESRSGSGEAGLLDRAQPYIDEANANTQSCGRIFKAVTLEPGTLVRAPKGTVVRKLSEQKLSGLIDSIYDKVGNV